MKSLVPLWQMNTLVLKNTLREYSLAVYLEKIFVHDLLNVLILSSLSLLGRSWNVALLLNSMPYFVFLLFFSSALSPWQSECWNRMSPQLRNNSVYLVMSRMLTGIMFSFPTWLLFFCVIVSFSNHLLRDISFLIVYALSGLFVGSATGLLTNLKNEKTISNFAQAAIWVLALGKSPFVTGKGPSLFMVLFPGGLLEVNPVYEAAKMMILVLVTLKLLIRRDSVVYER